ncbi:hypothetical protein NDU88_010782 [Pleurodeles waltl]|uniref:Uncharacterized protein n=1 Tax=Pleurodeles waltl TaxID=8319 RepID=A0AAV7QZT2_PLEWA|nr:hypothetical protein NDU88_010782 [Pleurodeles waltl]
MKLPSSTQASIQSVLVPLQRHADGTQVAPVIVSLETVTRAACSCFCSCSSGGAEQSQKSETRGVYSRDLDAREEMCWVLLLVPRAVEQMNEEPECGMLGGRCYGGSWSRRQTREDGWKKLS